MSDYRVDRGAGICPQADMPEGHDVVVAEPRNIRVWIVSDARHVRLSLVERLRKQAGISVVASAGFDPACLAGQLEFGRPDVLLLDCVHLTPLDTGSLPDFHCPEGLRILVLLDRADKQAAEDVLRRGFHGLLPTTSPTETISKAIREVSRGDIWMPRALLASVLGGWLNNTGAQRTAAELPSAGLRALSTREREILAQLKRGLTNKEIAGELGILEDTVKKHLQHVYNKLGVHSRATVLARAARLPHGSPEYPPDRQQ